MIRPLTAAAITLGGALAVALVTLAAEAVIRFAAPERLVLVTIPVALLAAYTSYLVWRGRLVARLGEVGTVSSMTASYSGRGSTARATLVILATLLLAFATARPQWGERTRSVTRKGIDVVFALDVSRSMLAGDVAPSRLDAAVAEMERLMQRLEGDRVGLVVFAGIAFVQSPLTSDYGALRLYLDRLSPDAIPTQGTAIGRAISEANKLLTGGARGEFERAESQLIIVFTDGEDHETDPVGAARTAQAAGIDVYTVGVGTPEGARIPIRNPDGSLLEYLRDRDGNVVVTRLVEEQLVAVADEGGGEFVRFSTEGAAAATLDAAIEAYDEEALSSALRQQYRDRFMLFLVPAFILLLIASIMGDRRRGAALVAVALIAASSVGCDDALLRVDPTVERAMEQLDAGEPDRALETLARAPGEAEEQPELHYDRGLVHEAREAWADAQESYLRALAVQAPDRQVSALYALGNALLAQEKLELAIERYRRALALDPAHEGARRNLEIAMARLFPACAELDDTLEENDDPGSAATLSPTVYKGTYLPPGVEVTGSEPPQELVLCGGDDDWFAIPVVGGATLDISVRFTRLRDDTGHEPPPTTIQPTSVRIALVDVDGETPLAVDQGLAGLAESVPVPASPLTRALEGVAISPTVDTNGIAYLRVETDGVLEYEYTVEITLTPPCWALEDEYETNDLRRNATELTRSGHYDARICASNDDWFGRSVGADESLFVDVFPPSSDEGEPVSASVAWFSGSGEEPTSETTLTESGATFEVRSPAAETRADVRIRSASGAEGAYRVSAYHYPPCPDGNDRYEPNNTHSRAHAIDHEQDPPPLRHLRLCEGDVDWFALPLPEVPEEDREDQPLRPFSALVEINGPSATAEIAVYDAATGRAVATSTPVASARADAFLDDAPPEGAIAFAELPWETEAVFVAVAGEPTFYHLSFPHTETQQQQQQQGEDEESDPSEEGEQGEQQQGEQQQGEQQQGDEGEGEQGASPEEGDEAAAQSATQEQAMADEDGEEQVTGPTDEEATEAQREALLQLLDSLEAEDVNLPLQQALEAAPSQRLRNEW
jgi:Ca-activated chloride channel family protein